MRRGSIVRITIYGVIAGTLASLVAVLVPWLPTSASEEMDRIEFTFWFTTVICIAIFAIVAAAIAYSVLKFRAADDDERDGPPIHGHTGLEIVWTAIPAVLVTAISVVSAVVLAKNDDVGENPLRIAVTAQQFAWKFEYPDETTSGQARAPRQPGRQADPALAGRDPLVLGARVRPEVGRGPGDRDDAHDHADPDRQLLGRLHRALRARARDDASARAGGEPGGVRGVPRERAAGGGSAPGGADDGAAVFAAAGCGGCHAFEPAGTDAAVGPSLDELEGDAASIRASIVDPSATLAPGYQDGVMPTTYGSSLSDEQLDALVQYLADGKAE